MRRVSRLNIQARAELNLNQPTGMPRSTFLLVGRAVDSAVALALRTGGHAAERAPESPRPQPLICSIRSRATLAQRFTAGRTLT